MEENTIDIKGARANNLKNVSIKIPLAKLTCLSGVSGSGKTSLAFHTLYTESKRRFLNSFPTYLKFFSERPAPVEVDRIYPILPVFGLPQINPVVGTRSTVGDIMNMTGLLQNLFYHHSQEYCPHHNIALEFRPLNTSLAKQLEKYSESEKFYVFITKHDFLTHFKDSPYPSRSFSDSVNQFNDQNPYWEIARFKKKTLEKVSTKLELYIEKKIDVFLVADSDNELQKLRHESVKSCPKNDFIGNDILGPQYFTPYNAIGACSVCNGFGATLEYDEDKLLDKNLSLNEGAVKLLEYKRFTHHYDSLISVAKKKKFALGVPLKDLPKTFWKLLYEGDGRWIGINSLLEFLESKKYKASVRIFIRARQKQVPCHNCEGTRLNPKVKNYKISSDSENYFELQKLSIDGAYSFIKKIEAKSPKKDFKSNIKKLKALLACACGIGIGHLDIGRKAKSLSAGEYQRLLLLKYLSYEGSGALFIFDEPSLGLSIDEKEKLLKGLKDLIKIGNTVIIIDHSHFFHQKSDHLIHMGPGAGKYGGKVLFEGDFKGFKKSDFFTKNKIELTPERKTKKTQRIKLKAPHLYDKTFKDISLPLNELTWVSGKSGSGKSAVMIKTLANKLHYDLYGEYLNLDRGSFSDITYTKKFENVIVVDANLNRYSSRSSFGSMTELFTIVRKHFLNTSSAKSMGLKDGHLSSNSQLGQCPNCEGRGFVTVEMQFLEDIVLECEDCGGKKLKPIYANLSDGKFTVHEAYSRPVHEILDHIKLTPKFARIYDYLKLLKLDYLSLNREVMSLSGGERQRLYLLSKIQKNITDSILFFENLSFGLSEVELTSTCKLLQDLVKKNNTVVVLDQDQTFEHVAQNKIVFN